MHTPLTPYLQLHQHTLLQKTIYKNDHYETGLPLLLRNDKKPFDSHQYHAMNKHQSTIPKKLVY